MIPITKRVISLLLAFIIGFTSVGFSADLHFCKGNLKSLAFFGNAKSCHEIESKPSCHSHKSIDRILESSCEKESDEDCCKNERFSNSFEFDAPVLLQRVDNETIVNEIQLTFSCFYSIEIDEERENYKVIHPPDKTICIKPSGNDLRIAIQSVLC